MNNIDEKIVANIKALAIDMIDEAKSGHPGIVLSSAKIIYTLYAKNLMVNPKDDKWINRDRFVMSAGHGSALLYATLYMAGFDITLDDLKKFRKLYSITPGHPELNITPGVDISTGPLGQGISSAVGMAIASKYLSYRYNTQNNEIFNNKIYVLAGDGDLMEGVTLEALSVAGNLNLNNLIILYDSNNMSLDSDTKNTMNEDTLDKFKAMNFNTILVKNGDDINAIDKAIKQAKSSFKPTIIEIKTILGSGSILENTNKVHGGALPSVDIEQLKKRLDVRNIKFCPSNDVVENFRKMIHDRVSSQYDKWCDMYSEILDSSNNKIKNELNNLGKNNNIIDYSKINNIVYEEIAFRDLNNKLINALDSNNLLMNASADLFSACKTKIDNFNTFTKDNYLGQNIYMGVREHGMASIMNGIASYNIMTISSTFLSFSDYLKPAIRMSALMNLKNLYIFTHDSILVGEDGPTHQPVDQITMLRAIPNFDVYRPSTFNELLGCYENIFKNLRPACLIITKNKIKEIKKGDKNKVKYGAYIIKEEKYKHCVTIMSSGEEAQLIIKVAYDLEEKTKKGIRVISVPCLDLFERQNSEYKKEILGEDKIVTFELSNDYKLARYANYDENIININEFGYSGNKDEILKYLDLDFDGLYKKLKKIIEY